MRCYFKIAILCLMMLTSAAQAQPLATKKVAKNLAVAIEKAYHASIRAWGFDTIRNERTSAQFSGVVVTSTGYILTAAHTIDPGKTYKIFFPSGKEAIAVALGKIEVKETIGIPDVGMMKIVTQGNWPYAEMGFSSNLVKAQTCISISYPESLNQALPTLRWGKIADVKNEFGFIQSTCKMEPGDSGGPLFDISGKVIGIHSAIAVAEDMNLEIPVELYRKYWTALMEKRLYISLPNGDAISNVKKLKSSYNPKDTLLQIVPIKATKSEIFTISSTIEHIRNTVNASLFNVSDSLGNQKQVFVSKNSMVGDSISLSFLGVAYTLEVMARNTEADLVLLQSKIQFNGGIDLNKSNAMFLAKPMGKFLFSLNQKGLPSASVMGSDTISISKLSSLPYLGAMVVYNSNPVVFSLIKEKSPAELAGLKMGDELISINHKAITNSADFIKEISLHWPNEIIELKWLSEGTIRTEKVKLAAQLQRTSNHPVDKFLGGKSIRRDGFNGVYTHDAALLPDQMGSAVFDAEANCIGINIARFSRASTLIMPVYQIYNFINNQFDKP